MIKPQRIIFAGTPKFSIPALEAIINSEHELVAVYTQPDRSSGRGRKSKFSDIKKFALEKGLKVETPTDLKNKNSIDDFQKYKPDLLVVVAYGIILTSEILDIPKYGCVNIHASILPRWRGAAPIQRSILAGDQFTGISIMRMEENLDSGPIYHIEKIPLLDNDTTSSLNERLSYIGAKTLIDCLAGIFDGSLPCVQQNTHQVSYAKKIEKSEAWIDWSESAIDINRKVRAFQPWPIAQTTFGEKIVRIWDVKPMIAKEGKTGALSISSERYLDVSTGQGKLRILNLQMPGKKIITSQDFINSYDVKDKFFGDK